jgi:uncharacterized membrane protein
MNRLFWVLATVVFGAVIHFAYVLYEQRIEMNGFINEAAASAEQTAVSSEAARKVLPAGLALGSVTYMCPFDVANADFQFTASMPDGPWVISVFTNAGENIFAVNDQQAGAHAFTVTVRKQRTLSGIFSLGEDTARAGDEWHVDSTAPRGLLLVWAAAQKEKRQRIEETLRKSQCKSGMAG